MLEVEDLDAGYGGGTVLAGISLHTTPGVVHTVAGANGTGKTTLVHTIAGLIRPTRGRTRLAGRDITTTPTHHRARAGIALVPQGRRVFASLTVSEHLNITTRHRTGQWDRATVLDLLPHLTTRLTHRGAALSGGEQQMLAIARALLTQPRLLLLDEPTEGLAPNLTTQIQQLITTLATDGLTILLTTPQPHPPTAADTTVLTGTHTTPPPPATAGFGVDHTGLPGNQRHLPAWTRLLPSTTTAGAPTARPPP